MIKLKNGEWLLRIALIALVAILTLPLFMSKQPNVRKAIMFHRLALEAFLENNEAEYERNENELLAHFPTFYQATINYNFAWPMFTGKQYSQDVVTLLNQADSLAQTKKYSHATEVYEQIIEQESQAWEAYYQLAAISFRLDGNCNKAMPLIKRALKVNTTHAGSHELLGRCYILDGKFDLAEREIRGAKLMSPHLRVARYLYFIDQYAG